MKVVLGRERRRARSSIRALRSMPTTLPFAPIAAASRWVTNPVPQPTSNTASPRRGPATSTSFAATFAWSPPAQLSYSGATRS